jgi:hypothetical protein
VDDAAIQGADFRFAPFFLRRQCPALVADTAKSGARNNNFTIAADFGWRTLRIASLGQQKELQSLFLLA